MYEENFLEAIPGESIELYAQRVRPILESEIPEGNIETAKIILNAANNKHALHMFESCIALQCTLGCYTENSENLTRLGVLSMLERIIALNVARWDRERQRDGGKTAAEDIASRHNAGWYALLARGWVSGMQSHSRRLIHALYGKESESRPWIEEELGRRLSLMFKAIVLSKLRIMQSGINWMRKERIDERLVSWIEKEHKEGGIEGYIQQMTRSRGTSEWKELVKGMIKEVDDSIPPERKDELRIMDPGLRMTLDLATQIEWL
jgi:hypothetical protein